MRGTIRPRSPPSSFATPSPPFPFVARFRSTPALSSQRRTVLLSAPIRPAISETDDPRANIVTTSPRSRSPSGTGRPSSPSRRAQPGGPTGGRGGARDPEAPATKRGSMPPARSRIASRFVPRGRAPMPGGPRTCPAPRGRAQEAGPPRARAKAESVAAHGNPSRLEHAARIDMPLAWNLLRTSSAFLFFAVSHSRTSFLIEIQSRKTSGVPP